MPRSKSRISVDVPRELYTRLAVIARRDGLTVAALTAIAVRELLAREEGHTEAAGVTGTTAVQEGDG